MGRKIAVPWHASFTIAAGLLYFYFVLPRWPELMGDTTHGLGTTLRIVTGVLIGLAALPVVFTLLRVRKPELGTPQLALSTLTWSIVAHVLAGVLIIGTAISEIWVNLDAAGQWLFAIYGAAAAVAVLGIFSFYLSFVAELPPPPPKPIKAKKAKKERRRKRRKGDEADEADDIEETEETATEDKDEEAATEADDEEPEGDRIEPDEAEVTETVQAQAVESETVESDTGEAETVEDEVGGPESVTGEPRSALRNRRPTGKTSHRRRPRREVAVDE